MRAFLAKKKIVMSVFAFYLSILFYFLFLSGYLGRNEAFSYYRYNLVLFREITRYLKRPEAFGFLRVFINLAGNILAFIPLGFFLPVFLAKRKKFLFTLFFGFFFVVIVEFLQVFSRVGCYDVDDILLNMIGILIGYFLYSFLFYKK